MTTGNQNNRCKALKRVHLAIEYRNQEIACAIVQRTLTGLEVPRVNWLTSPIPGCDGHQQKHQVSAATVACSDFSDKLLPTSFPLVHVSASCYISPTVVINLRHRVAKPNSPRRPPSRGY